MVQHLPGPYELRVRYRVPTLEHLMRINVDVTDNPQTGIDPAQVTLKTKDNVGVNFVTAANALLTAMKALYKNDCEIYPVELHKYTGTNLDTIFITAGGTAVTGTSAVASTLAHQVTATYRSQNGGVAKITLLESVNTSVGYEAYPTANTALNTFFSIFVASNSYALARDNGYFAVGYRILYGQNEAVFRKRYRP